MSDITDLDNSISHLRTAVFGRGLEKQIKEVYRLCCEHATYPEDEIFLLAPVEELLQSELWPISFTTCGCQKSRRTWLTLTISIWNCFDYIPRSSRKGLAVLAISTTTCRRRGDRLLSQVSNLLERLTPSRTSQTMVCMTSPLFLQSYNTDKHSFSMNTQFASLIVCYYLIAILTTIIYIPNLSTSKKAVRFDLREREPFSDLLEGNETFAVRHK
jgi:hypothetical protein